MTLSARPMKPCEVCGKSFQRNPKYSKAQWEAVRFCSRGCRVQAATLPRAICACGCGKPVRKLGAKRLYEHRDFRQPVKPLQFHKETGRWYYHHGNGRREPYARVVMERELGRPLRKGEVVHHVNGDCSDDRPENLELFASHSEHMRAEYQRGNLPHLAGESVE